MVSAEYLFQQLGSCTRPRRNVLGGGGPHDSTDRLVEGVANRLSLQTGRPHHAGDGLFEWTQEQESSWTDRLRDRCVQPEVDSLIENKRRQRLRKLDFPERRVDHAAGRQRLDFH